MIQLSEYFSEYITNKQNYDDSGSEQGTRQSIQDEQSARSETHAETNVAHERHRPPPVTRMHEPRDCARSNATLPLSETTQGQRSHPQAYIQGNVRFTNCGQVNITSNVASWGRCLRPDGGPLAPLVVEGNLVFEGCKVVNILTPAGPIPYIQRRQNQSRRPRQRRPEPQHHSPRVSQTQVPLQHPRHSCPGQTPHRT